MSKRTVTLLVSVVIILLGLDTLRTGRGSHVFGWHSRNTPFGDIRYTGPFATTEGLVFVGAGVYGLCRAIRNDVDSDD